MTGYRTTTGNWVYENQTIRHNDETYVAQRVQGGGDQWKWTDGWKWYAILPTGERSWTTIQEEDA